MKHSNIFFPIESIARELDPKLLIAGLMSDQVGDIVFAQHDLVDQLIQMSANGIYFGKNIMNPLKIDKYKLAKEKGFQIVHLDEEGGVYQGQKPDIESILDTRLNVASMDSDDYVFTWGQFQTDHYKSKCETSKQPTIKTSGHIRFDLFKKKYRSYYEDLAKKHTKQHGSYILICSTFGYAVSPYGVGDTFSKRNGYGISEYSNSRLVEEWSEQMHKVAHFIALVHSLSKFFTKTKIIVRPHTAEDQEFYQTTLNDLENVSVINKGSSASWIIGSEVVIHNGSTIGLESYFAEKPVIHYEFQPNEKFDSFIIRKIGRNCRNPQEAIETISEALEGKKITNSEDFDDLDHKLLQDLGSSNPNNLPKMLEEIIMGRSNKHKPQTVSIIRIYIMEYIYQIKDIFKKPIRSIFFPGKQREYLADTLAFPGFKKTDLHVRLSKIEKLTGKRFKIKYISERIFFLRIIP